MNISERARCASGSVPPGQHPRERPLGYNPELPGKKHTQLGFLTNSKSRLFCQCVGIKLSSSRLASESEAGANDQTNALAHKIFSGLSTNPTLRRNSRRRIAGRAAAARGFRGLLRFFILACQRQPKKEFNDESKFDSGLPDQRDTGLSASV